MESIGSMECEPLGCHDLGDRELATRKKDIARAITALNVPYRVAIQIVEDALQRGHAKRPEDETPLSYSRQHRYAKRRTFDLFVSLLRSARQMNLGRREVLEQAAWQMLSGDFSIQ